MDGIIRNYNEFRTICSEYYNQLQSQQVKTNYEHFRVINRNLVLVNWNGDITAKFKNNDVMIMRNYAISYLFEKTDNNWKIIHSHESSLPPEVTKGN